MNIGSKETVTIDRLAELITGIARKRVEKRYVLGPTGVQKRNSDNRLIREKLGWAPS